MFPNCFRVSVVCVIFCGLPFLSGCGYRGAASLSYSEDKAQESLTTFLDAWQAGGTPADLKQRSPAIIGRDFDWEGGAELVSYQFAGTELNDGTNLHALVDLTLRRHAGQEIQVRAKYIVGTSPSITVFRSDEEYFAD